MRSAVPTLCLVTLLAAGGGAGAAPGHPFVAGEPLPELVLPSLGDGAPRALAATGGRRSVLLVFASW